MQWYVVYRHGRNPIAESAECGLPEKMAVARLRAESAQATCQQAAEVMLAGNQPVRRAGRRVDGKE